MDGSLIGVIHNRGRLDGIVSHILMLVTIAHVDFAPLALPEVAHGTWPDSGLDDHDIVLLGSMEGVCHGVAHAIAIGTQNPGGVVALARLVLTDWL